MRNKCGEVRLVHWKEKETVLSKKKTKSGGIEKKKNDESMD